MSTIAFHQHEIREAHETAFELANIIAVSDQQGKQLLLKKLDRVLSSGAVVNFYRLAKQLKSTIWVKSTPTLITNDSTTASVSVSYHFDSHHTYLWMLNIVNALPYHPKSAETTYKVCNLIIQDAILVNACRMVGHNFNEFETPYTLDNLHEIFEDNDLLKPTDEESLNWFLSAPILSVEYIDHAGKLFSPDEQLPFNDILRNGLIYYRLLIMTEVFQGFEKLLSSVPNLSTDDNPIWDDATVKMFNNLPTIANIQLVKDFFALVALESVLCKVKMSDTQWNHSEYRSINFMTNILTSRGGYAIINTIFECAVFSDLGHNEQYQEIGTIINLLDADLTLDLLVSDLKSVIEKRI